MWTHHSSSWRSILATSESASSLQDCLDGLEVCSWCHSSLSQWPLHTATTISGRQHLWSAATGTLLVPRAQTATGQQSFAVNGPATWNRLPLALVTRPVWECLQAGTEEAPALLSTARHHWHIFMILALHINIQTDLLNSYTRVCWFESRATQSQCKWLGTGTVTKRWVHRYRSLSLLSHRVHIRHPYGASYF